MTFSYVRLSYTFVFLTSFFATAFAQSLVLTTLYGTFHIKEPVLIELINSPSMQRLKKVRQYGTDYFTLKKEDYNRFDHSVGVMVLARKYGADLKEQIAALLHDVSHTAFSHVADFVYKKTHDKDAYQDDIHEQFISSCELKSILSRYGFSVADIAHKNKAFTILEQELPDLCADRLEYNLRGGLLQELLTHEDISIILQDLKFEANRWYFTSISSAKKLAHVSLYMSENRWTSAESMVRNTWTAQALKRAFDLNYITPKDFQNNTDDNLWHILVESTDSLIQDLMKKVLNSQRYFVLDTANYDLILKGKSRGINPWIKTETGFSRLSSLDSDFEQEYKRIKQVMFDGWHIKFVN